MTARELINHMIPPLKPSDLGSKAVAWMEELRTNELPVVEKGEFKGLISEEAILDQNDIERPVSSYNLVSYESRVHDFQHFYDVIRVASDHGSEIVAVLNEKDEYLGVISIEDTIAAFAQTTAVQNPGGILILSMKQIDYSLTEISRLIEEDNAKILSSCVNNDVSDPSKLKLTLKINKIDLTRTIATLERFGYKIIAKFQEIPDVSTDKERLDILLKYLNV